VKESSDRVFAAPNNSGFHPPRTRTTINLAPGDLRKEGPLYDLPIALGVLAATQQLPAERLGDWLIAGELSLSAATRPIRGALAMARLARQRRKRGFLLTCRQRRALRVEVAHFNQRGAGLATAAGHHHRVTARREADQDGGVLAAGWQGKRAGRAEGGLQGGVTAPIVVGRNDEVLAERHEAQLRIGQRSANAELGEAGADGADQQLLRR
jgi:hypothetical protein